MRFTLWVLICFLSLACSTANNNPCAVGSSAPCACSNGSAGAQVCGENGTFGQCSCDDQGGAGVSDSGALGGADTSTGSTPSGGPTFLSFGTNVTSITEPESLTFTAVVSHPQGSDALAGGSLVSPDGAIQYGPFGTGGAQKGAYSVTLSWSAINQAKTIEFAKEDKREFIAQFFDTQGRKATKTVTIRLHCNGAQACHGSCDIDFQNDRHDCGSCGHDCGSLYCFGGRCRSSG